MRDGIIGKRMVKKMKTKSVKKMQYGWIAAATVVLCLVCGCGTVSTEDSALTEKDADNLYPIDPPKACPGVLEESYLVIDISGGQAAATWPVTTLNKIPSDGWGDEFKTDKIVLRKVNSGSYWRQSCSAEEAWKRKTKNPPCERFVNKSFYIGVFEITQRQYEHVTGMRPSRHSPSEGWEKLPVETVSYDDIRGRREGAKFPNSHDVDAQSFLGILRQKTGIKNLDLPSEGVWEYCCSAGGSYIDMKQLDANARFSRYPTVKEPHGAPAVVGSYKPNVLGLYDMQGNVNEWCMDHIGKQEPKEVPFRQFGCDRVVKGGHYDSIPELCHPSITYSQCSSFGDSTIGFRICRY